MKLNLLKKLLTLTPVVISPILVTACGSSDNGGKDNKPKDISADGKFYLDFYQRELENIWLRQITGINLAALNLNHHYDLQLNLLNEVLTKVKADGAAEFKKDFPKLDNYDPSIFDDVAISFTIPDDSKGNLKIVNNILSVYPASVMDGIISEKHIDYTLKLNSNSKVSAKEVSGNLKFNLQAGFVNYNDAADLQSNKVFGLYGNADLSTILVGTYSGGIDVGTKQAGGGYKFDNYDTSSGLKSNLISSVYGSTDMSNILVGTNDGGLDVGTRAKATDRYSFKNYSTSSASKLADNNIYDVTGNSDLSTILVAEIAGGLDVGTRAKASDAYAFKNYKSSDGLISDDVNSVACNTNTSQILVGTDDGISVGARSNAADPYTFTNYSDITPNGLNNNNVQAVAVSSNLSTILVGEYGGGLDVGTKQGDGKYTFDNYKTAKGLLNSTVTTVSGNADMSTILVGTSKGISLGKRASASDPYTFANYTTSSGLSDSYVNVGAINNLSTILVGTDSGLDISSNLWFA